MELKADHLGIGYAGEQIAYADRLELNTGQLTGIIGINGSGKSTLLKTLQGNLRPITGEISIGGRSMMDHTQGELAKKLSMVSSRSAISSALTVEEIIRLGRQPYTDWLGKLSETDKRVVERAISTLQVSDLKLRYFDRLSDGQKQRVMIARALAQDTPFILLDEPVTHLDMYHQSVVFDLLRKITRKNNKGIIFSSHQINVVLDICDELIVIDKAAIHQRSVRKWLEGDALKGLFPSDHIRFDEATGRFRLK